MPFIFFKEQLKVLTLTNILYNIFLEKARNIFTFYCYFIIVKSSVKNKFGKEVGMTTTQDLVAKVGVEPTTFRL